MALTDRGRLYLFWLACIPVRTCIAAACVHVGIALPHLLPAVAAAAAVPAVGFAVNAVRGCRGTYLRGGLGGAVWWQVHRPVHALLYGATCAAAAAGAAWAGVFLVVDVAYAVLVAAARAAVTAPG